MVLKPLIAENLSTTILLDQVPLLDDYIVKQGRFIADNTII